MKNICLLLPLLLAFAAGCGFFPDDQSYTDQPFAKLSFKEMAENGDAESQWKLGHWFYCDANRRKNTTQKNEAYAEAIKWFRKAAEQGQPEAQSFLGQAYEFGHGVEKDLAEAVKWKRESAEQGNGSAQYWIGQAYVYGWCGLEQDGVEGVKWLRKAAVQKYGSSALYTLGSVYAEGVEGVPQDKAEAVKWFRWAASLGDKYALEKLKELGSPPPDPNERKFFLAV